MSKLKFLASILRSRIAEQSAQPGIGLGIARHVLKQPADVVEHVIIAVFIQNMIHARGAAALLHLALQAAEDQRRHLRQDLIRGFLIDAELCRKLLRHLRRDGSGELFEEIIHGVLLKW